MEDDEMTEMTVTIEVRSPGRYRTRNDRSELIFLTSNVDETIRKIDATLKDFISAGINPTQHFVRNAIAVEVSPGNAMLSEIADALEHALGITTIRNDS